MVISGQYYIRMVADNLVTYCLLYFSLSLSCTAVLGQDASAF